jgi:hypothetical protein
MRLSEPKLQHMRCTVKSKRTEAAQLQSGLQVKACHHQKFDKGTLTTGQNWEHRRGWLSATQNLPLGAKDADQSRGLSCTNTLTTAAQGT